MAHAEFQDIPFGSGIPVNLITVVYCTMYNFLHVARLCSIAQFNFKLIVLTLSKPYLQSERTPTMQMGEGGFQISVKTNDVIYGRYLRTKHLC